MEKRIKLICFDIGNTLVYDTRSRYYHTHLVKSFFKKYGITKDIDLSVAGSKIFNSKIHKDIDKAINYYMQKIGVTKNKKEFFSKTKKSFLEGHKYLKWYKESKYVLKKLRNKDYKIAFISNWNQYARAQFEYIGLSKYAEHIIISSEHGERKPHPSLFKEVLRIFHIKPEEVLMIGDQYKKDYLPSKSLRMHALLIKRKKDAAHPDVIKDLREVFNYLDRINEKN